MMATVEQYAEWIVNNADKKGTPDFETVAAAYQAAKQQPRNDTIGRQVGLGVRAMVKGAAIFPAIATDAVGGIANTVADAVGGKTDGPFRFRPLVPTLDRAMTQMGLPEPQTPEERIVGQGVEMGTGAATGAGLAARGAQYVGPLAKAGLERLGAATGTQMAGGAGAGLAGQQAKERGGGWLDQLVSSVVGGLTAGGAVQGAARLGSAAAGMFQSPRFTVERIDQTINVALKANGIDPASVNPAMRRALQEQVTAALKKGGQLDDAAVARLADYTRTRTTPTAGRLSLDPYQITQEMNASKQAAALGARDAQLPQIASDNNQRLISLLDDFGPLADRTATGARATAPIVGKDAAMQNFERQLYGAAESMGGGSIPLERGALNQIYDKLKAARKFRFLPKEVSDTIDDVLNDTRSPFDVNSLDELKSIIATQSRGSTGNVKTALKIVRDSLDNIVPTPVKRQFGGNQVVTQATAQKMTAADKAAADLMAQLNKARQAAFERRTWQRSSPLIENTLDDADPSRFVETIVSRATAPKDVATAAKVINASEDARKAVRSGIAQYLKDAAIGKGNQSATGNFSGRQLAAALDNIGTAKLRLFFDADEIAQLQAMARVGITETFQPRGSAVNNSNTGAAMAALLQGLTKYIKPIASKVPLGEEVFTRPLANITLSSMERNALNTPLGLLLPGSMPRNSLIDMAALPTVAASGNLLAPR